MMLEDAQEFWSAIERKVRAACREEMSQSLQCARYDVTTAPDGTKMGVKKPFAANEIFVPYSEECKDAAVGDPVLVVWWGGMSTAKACWMGSGFQGATDIADGSITTAKLADKAVTPAKLSADVLKTVYPIGSIYMSVNSTSPASLFGGSWTQLKDRFLLGTGDTYTAGSTGGEATHTLTVEPAV